MKFGVVIFPGSNCDEDIIYALQTIMDCSVVRLWHKERNLKGCDVIILPGGFSYGDYLRSGAIARFAPVMDKVAEHADKGGYVIGICNGFQILCEAGLLPGALLHNISQQFICDNYYIRAQTANSLLTSAIDHSKALKIPVAHGEGCYYADKTTMSSIIKNDQVIFRYCDEFGEITKEANPNGSADNIAGICNSQRNIYGMMPHPERAADKELSNSDGLAVLMSILSYQR